MALSAGAQTLGSAFDPDIVAGRTVAEYRFSLVPSENGAPDRYGHRINWEKAIDGRRQIRFLAAATGPEGDVNLTSFSTQFYWQATPDSSKTWISGFRLDLTAGLNGRSDSVTLGWSNKFNLGDGWSARAMAQVGAELGDHSRDGALLETRFRVSKRLTGGKSLGVDMLNSYGSSEAFGSFDDENHRAGPYLTFPVSDDWTIYTGMLFGLSDRAADTEARFRIGRSF